MRVLQNPAQRSALELSVSLAPVRRAGQASAARELALFSKQRHGGGADHETTRDVQMEGRNSEHGAGAER